MAARTRLTGGDEARDRRLEGRDRLWLSPETAQHVGPAFFQVGHRESRLPFEQRHRVVQVDESIFKRGCPLREVRCPQKVTERLFGIGGRSRLIKMVRHAAPLVQGAE